MDYMVLIVDDNEKNRFTLKAILDSIEIPYLEAGNGSEAIEILLRHEIDLILLDIQLPDIDGFEVAKMIKSRKTTREIPIIFTTAVFKSDDYIMKGFELGAVDYILKPFKFNVIVSKIRHYQDITLERKRLLKKLELRNTELELNIEKLSRTQHDLQESMEKWRLLGENIPYNIEIYSNIRELVFENKSLDSDSMKKLHEAHDQAIKKQIHDTLLQGTAGKKIYKMRDSDKDIYYECKSVFIDNKYDPSVMLIINDVTLQKEHLDDMKYIGYHDHLTGLWNRRYVAEYMQDSDIDDMLPLTVMMSDVNGLKLINDGIGHMAGDELIKAATACLKSCAGPNAIIARWGGDEFLLLVPRTDSTRASLISRSIVEMIEGEKIADKFPVSMAVGHITCEDEAFQLEDLIKEAEDRMYVSKMQNRSSYRSFVVESLKNALFEQDYETKEHTERISKMANKVADHLKLNQNDRNKLSLLGSLHDIGKIGISTSILNHAGDLSDIDWNIIRRHPEIGYRICVNVPELTAIADLILSHHERWDGQGYPRKLKGTQIPLLSRLIAILDTFDVITHDRPYKEAKSAEWALQEIRRCSGSQFDPNLVNVFEHVYRELVEEDQ